MFTPLFVPDNRCFCLQRRCITLYNRPPFFPVYTVEHQHSSFRIGHTDSVIKHPIRSFIICYDLRVVPGTHECFIFINQHFMMILQHRFPFFIYIRAK